VNHHRTRAGFTVGFVLEEQTGRPAAEGADGFDLESYPKAYPTVVAGITEYFQPGRTVDDLFADCLALIIGGAPKS
jgi:TetR/AcrR family tetracycline transcriptional repressor